MQGAPFLFCPSKSTYKCSWEIGTVFDAGEKAGVWGGGDDDFVAIGQGDVGLAVYGEEGFVISVYEEVYAVIVGEDEALDDGQVGGDRGDDDAAQLRVEDGAACRHRVGGGAGGGGDDYTVGYEGGDAGIVDTEGTVDDAGEGRAASYNVVQRDEGINQMVAAPKLCQEHGALFEPVLFIEECREVFFDLRWV